MQKVVLSLDLHDGKNCKKKALKIVASVTGISSVTMDMKEKKLILIGEMDPLQVVNKLRKTYRTEIVTIGPEKEQENDEKPKEPEVTHFVNTSILYNPFYYPYYQYNCS